MEMERLSIEEIKEILNRDWNEMKAGYFCINDFRAIEQSMELLDELKAYRDAEEQGLLYRTKVAIGQTVYTNIAVSGWYLRCKDRPYKAKVVFMGLNDSEEMGGGFFNVEYEKGYMMAFNFSDIGKSVFLTREEAERALAEMQKG